MKLRKTFETLSAGKLIFGGLILLGVVLRVRQYLIGRSLWLDEAMLALNIVGRSFGGLLQPLDYNQGAPLGFLLAEKLVVTLTGNHEVTLRLLPLLAGCAALLLYALLLRQVTGKIGGFTAMALLAVGAAPVYYASEVKQYSSDVFIVLLLLWLAGKVIFHQLRQPEAGFPRSLNSKMLFLAVGGVLALWCSHPALFVLVAIGITLALHYALRKDLMRLRQMALVLLVWGLSFGVLYFVNLRGLAGNKYLVQYWAGAFMPMPVWEHLDWFGPTLQGMLNDPVGLGTYWPLAAALMLVGWVALLRRTWQFGVLFGLVLGTTLAASALGKYPFAGRMILFIVPVFLALAGSGLDAFVEWLRGPRWLGSGLAVMLAAVLLFQPLIAAQENLLQPTYYEHVRPAMAFLQANRRPNDAIYVYSWAVPAFRYYAPAYGLAQGDYVTGKQHGSNFRVPLVELKQFMGNSHVWVLFSHIYVAGDFNEKDYILAYLNKIGKQKRLFYDPGTSVYLALYDLGGP